MSFCKPVDEIGVFWFGDETYEILGDRDVEDLVLSVRNGDIYQMVADIDDTKEGGDNICQVMDAIEDIREAVTVAGLMRPEITYVLTPEMYFVVNYVIELGLIDDYRSVCMPYFESNEDYESYVFCYERVERIFHILRDILNGDELYKVIIDVSYLDQDVCEKNLLESAKRKIAEHKDEIRHDLEATFAMF